jgi:putative DNA primase/helicase
MPDASGFTFSEPGQAAPLRILSAAEFLELAIKPREMALSPILPLPGLAMLYAPRGMGKTYVALSMSYAMAAGGKALH